MIRIAPCTFIATLLFAPTVLGQEVDDSIRFVVSRPSSVTIERTSGGGFRVTVEPLGGGGGSLPVPPKPDPGAPPKPDPFGSAVASLPDSQRALVLGIVLGDARTVAGLIDGSSTDEDAANFLLASTVQRLNAQGIQDVGVIRGVVALINSIPSMTGGSVPARLEAFISRLKAIQ